jgi:sugar lactone lactonase YvrE
MHLIATLVNAFFIIMLWWWNRSLININHQLMNDNRYILNEAKKLQERMNDIEAKMPGTMWVDTETSKPYVRGIKDNKKGIQ